MFLPIGTDRQLRRRAIITPALVFVTCLASAAMFILLRNEVEWALELRTRLYIIGGEGFRWWQLWSHTLLHGDWLHLAGNMIFLWVFGRAVEDKYGHLGFLALYLVGAAAAGGLHVLVEVNAAVGASGAIAAVTGAFLVLFPRTRVKVLFLFLLISVFMVPAWWVIGISITIDMLRALTGAGGGVAVFAHLGGYAFGIALSMALLKFNVFAREPYDLFTVFRQTQRRAEMRAAMRGYDKRLGRVRQASPETAARAAPLTKRVQTDRDEADSNALAEARAAISRAVSRGRPQEAVSRYRSLLARFGPAGAPADDASRGKRSARDAAVTLARDTMLAVAGELYKEGDIDEAVRAYERFLAAYPTDREKGHVKLLIGRAIARTAHQPERLAHAATMLGEAKDELVLDEYRELAEQELAAIRARAAAPAGRPDHEGGAA